MQNGKHVVLVVDDDQDIRYSLRLVLEGGGYAVHEAPTAEEGLKRYKQTQPDVIIVDLMMEEVDSGTGFVKELRAIGNQAPIYMLSSVGDNLSMNADYSELGLSGVFQKPVDNGTLLAILKSKLN
jgi:CheY-like chemotaxis protein